jgi:hypothetical protein
MTSWGICRKVMHHFFILTIVQVHLIDDAIQNAIMS